MNIFIGSHWIRNSSNLASVHHLVLWEVNLRNVEGPEKDVDLGVPHRDVGEKGGLDGEDFVADAAGVS